ncbi:MAG TPA: DsbA family protein [Gaiellaceae bacterium]|jgi:protein-disulfide isomerase|nr:DsbA family protein [Gaiellaceae bacterium]
MSAVLDRPRLIAPLGPEDHTAGPPTARVTLVEYGDYECPFCKRANPVVKRLQRLLEEDLLFAYRHFPLAQIHPHALDAAIAAEAAGAQDRFWEMHDLLFAHQDRLAPRNLLVLARTIDLDLERFAEDLTQRTYEPKVRRDFMTGVRSGVNGTPTFFINGVRHNGSWDLESLLDGIRSTLD